MNKIFILLSLAIVCGGKEIHKILGGSSTNIKLFPHYVSLQYHQHHICGGSILTKYHVLTSSSCVLFDLNIVAGNLRVLAGSNDKLNTNGIGTYHNVEYIIYHADYSPRLFWRNDIAILRLESPIQLSSAYNNIEAFKISKTPITRSTSTETCGWEDNTINPQRYTSYLKRIHIKTRGVYFCKIYSGFPNIGESKSCGTAMYQNSFITLGDGGNGITRRQTIIGVTSVFLKTTKTNIIIFSKIFPSYNDWIENILLNN